MKHKKSITVRFLCSIIAIFLIVFGLSLWFEIKTYHDVKAMTAVLEEVHTLAEAQDREKTLPAYYELKDLWNRHKDHWYYYLNHTIIKETDFCIVRIGAFLENEQYGDALAEEAALRRLLHDVKNHDLPLIHNII